MTAPAEVKLCKNCKWYEHMVTQFYLTVIERDCCNRPELAELVHGAARNCQDLRGSGLSTYKTCGPEANYWQPKS